MDNDFAYKYFSRYKCFFAGIETNTNRAVVRAYKVVLEQMLHETCDRLDSLELKNV